MNNHRRVLLRRKEQKTNPSKKLKASTSGASTSVASTSDSGKKKGKEKTRASQSFLEKVSKNIRKTLSLVTLAMPFTIFYS